MESLLDFFKAYDIALSQVVIVVIILLLTIAANFLIHYFFKRYEKSTHHSQTVKTILYVSLMNPLRLVTFSLGFYFIAMNVLTWFKFTSFFAQFVIPGVKLGLALSFFIFMNTFASRLKSYLIAKQTRTDGGYNNFAKADGARQSGGLPLICIIATS